EPENEKLFTGLKIWQTGDDILKHCGKYPVIYLNFKDVKTNTWEDCYELLASEIANLYEKHNYLLKNNILTETETNVFRDILSETASKVKSQRSLKKLSEYLQRYHKQKVVILIDEYDTPIQAGYKKYYDEVISFMRNLLSGAFKDNSELYKGVITGILRVSKESIFTGLNNVSVHTILNRDFSDKFGFTEDEVKQILIDFEVKTEYRQIKEWYDGYRFGETENIYNPWSILNYAIHYKEGFNTFWANSSYNELIRERILERDYDYIKDNFEKLLQGEQIIKKIEDNIVFTDLEKTGKELLWSLLLFSGYLKATPLPEQKNSLVKLQHYNLSIPNGEIKQLFKDIISEWLIEKIQISSSLLYNAARNLTNDNLKQFEKELRSIMGDTFSYFDKTKNPENAFHSYMLGLLTILGDDYIIRSNRESGKGRYDILLRPFDITKNGIVIEIKTIEDRKKDEGKQEFHNRINKAINEAKNQIETKEYEKELIDNKIKNIIKLPIIFAGKRAHIFTVE
ncbi:MAG: AAA family ATPase, partial [Bacteroidota bacterium]|nr:AAA family ATPase [Bacteroidota bacterium]